MAQTKNGYVPAGIQKQMDQHMQRLPANLQKYQSGNTYIPAKAAQEMTNYMKKTMPAHMQEYVTPYMHQQTVAGMNSLDPVSTRTPQQRAPTPDLMRRDHSAFGEQFTVNTDAPISFSQQYSPQQNTPSPVPPPMSPAPQQDDPYGFILNNPAKKNFSLLPSGNSPQQRLIMIVFVVVILLIVGTIVAVIFASGSGGGSTESLVKATQQQQEIARISDEANKKSRGSDAKNLAAVTGMTIYSDQFTLKTYLQTKGKKLGAKDLALGKNAKNDTLLTQAEQTNRFDEVYLTMVVRDLAAYRTTLRTARSDADKKGRAVIDVLIKHADLLLQKKPN